MAHRHEGPQVGVPTDKIAYVEVASEPEIARSASAFGTRVVIGPAPDLLDRRLLFFTGKGGVGKSTVAAATALLASNIGKRVLLVEVDAKGDIPAQFEQRPVGFEPREVHPGVLAMAMDTEASLHEYLQAEPARSRARPRRPARAKRSTSSRTRRRA